MAESVESLLTEARGKLARAAFGPSTREAVLLLGRVLELSEAQLLARFEIEVGRDQVERFRSLLDRRLAGEPIAYILGTREFYGRSFQVDERVLIPRPETEHLVEAALDQALPERPRVLDIGTGSGCIAITLALELERARVVATDTSLAALSVAAANLEAHAAAERVTLVNADLASGFQLEAFDLVVSNPPYIDPAVAPTLSSEVTRFEPNAALFAPEAGFATIRRLLGQGSRLKAGTALILEIGYDQADRLSNLAEASSFRLEEIREDLAGHPRTAVLVRE